MAENISSEEKSLLALNRVKNITLFWASVVAIILIVQAYLYNGLYARIAEWQFSRFEALFPFSSLALTTFFLSLPLLVLYAVRKRRHRRLYGRQLSADQLQSTEKKYRFLRATTIIVVLATLIAFLLSLIVPDYSDREVKTFSAVNPITNDGPVTANANVLYNRLASYSQKTLFTRNEILLAPLSFDDTDTTIRHFLVVQSTNKSGPQKFQTVRGYARKTKLPGGFKVLYTNSGYTIGQDTYVIHQTSEAALKRQFGLAETLARLGLWLCLALLFTFAYRRRLKRKNQDSVNPVT